MNWKISDAYCFECHKELDRVIEVGGENQPKPGDISVCAGCLAIGRFDDDLKPQPLNEVEYEDIIKDPRVALVLKAFEGET